MELVEVTSYRVFRTELLGLCGKGVLDDEQWMIRIKGTKSRDASSVKGRLIVELRNWRFGPGNICVMFRFILYGGGS